MVSALPGDAPGPTLFSPISLDYICLQWTGIIAGLLLIRGVTLPVTPLLGVFLALIAYRRETISLQAFLWLTTSCVWISIGWTLQTVPPTTA